MQDRAEIPAGLTPGMHITPGVMSYAVERRVAASDKGPTPVVVLHVEHATGSTVMVMNAAADADLGRKLLEVATGLHLPTVG